MYTVDVSADFFKEAVESSPIVIFHSSLTDVRTLIDWLDSQGLDFRSVEMPMANRQHRELFQHLSETYAWHTLPMIFLKGQFVGGEPELRLALQKG